MHIAADGIDPDTYIGNVTAYSPHALNKHLSPKLLVYKFANISIVQKIWRLIQPKKN